VRKKDDKMANSFGLWNVDSQTRLHFRIICIQKGMTGAQLLREMVAKEWVSEGKKRFEGKKVRLIKRVVRRAMRRKALPL